MLGDNIKKRRIELNMTQKALSKDICTQSQISKIEKNEIMPLSNLLKSISKKLNISMDQLMNNSVKYSCNEHKIDKSLFNNLLITRNYSQIEALLNKINKEKLIDEDKIYFEWLNLLLDNIMKSEYILDRLNLLFHNNELNMNDELKITILNAIGVQSRIEKKYKESRMAFEKALSYKNIMTSHKLVVKVLYNFTNLLFELEDWSELKDILDDTIVYTYQNHQYEILPELIYSKYYCMNKLGIAYLNNEELITAKFLAKKQMKFDTVKLLNEIIESIQ
ncbi:helix-turn-helix domain-containing protein [Macrococcus animalis]|uniref:helix-turn-helix domain-containing protein n=1 Tax=Macrococcus animalis TaxID=3395467 RepID=UPI0039BEB5CD